MVDVESPRRLRLLLLLVGAVFALSIYGNATVLLGVLTVKTTAVSPSPILKFPKGTAESSVKDASLESPSETTVAVDAETTRPPAASGTAHPPHVNASLSAELHDMIDRHRWAAAVWRAVSLAVDPERDGNDTIPNMIVPVFHDASELRRLLESIDCAVRLFSFAWNSDDHDVRDVMQVLTQLPYGVRLTHHPENVGFSGAINRGIHNAENYALVHGYPLREEWYFLVNADTVFPQGNLLKFARRVSKAKSTHGLFYGPRQDHFAFAVTRLAIETVGYFDEVFFPGYMEDIDLRWRVRIAGLPQIVTGIHFHHAGSVNMKKNIHNYRAMLTRSSSGWEYGWMKWGYYTPSHIEHDGPPSRWKTPFNIPNASLRLWAIDPAHRACIRTGRGTYHVASSTCWYNGTVLLPLLPTEMQKQHLPKYLTTPGPSGRERKYW